MTEESGIAQVRIENQDGVATVTLASPSLSTTAKTALRDALNVVSADQEVRAVLLTGMGKTFCMGQDLGEHAAALEADPGTAFTTLGKHYNPIVTALTTMPKPVVAAITGTCVGAGLGFA